jgi:tetratricopeptide (TPR) repeat protein
MYDFGACPRCKMEIESERLRNSVIVCNHCGYTANMVQRKIEQAAEKSFIVIATGLCALMSFAFVMAVQWDTHTFEVLPLKAKQMIGMTTASDLQRLVEICESRKNVDCQLQATEQLTRFDNEAFASLGKLHFLSNKNKQAIASFSQYFRNGGLNLEASYNFARALEKEGQVEMASQYYETVIDARPETLQITVTRHYINMLIEYNKKSEAKMVLAKIREKGANTKNFMDPVFKELEKSVQ